MSNPDLNKTNVEEQRHNNTTKLSGRFRRALVHRRLPVALALLAVVLTLPSLWTGLVADDHFRHMMMIGFPGFPDLASSPLLKLDVIADGNPERTLQLMEMGELPWWTLPELRIAAFRPLSALSLWLDYRLWPAFPILMHVQNLLWFGLLVATATILYRRFMGVTAVAGLAALLYAIDDARGFPVAWVNTRYALMTTLFGLIALLAHDRWRREGWRSGAFLAPLCLGLSLLSGEAGIAIGGYLLAYALCLDRGTWLQRILSLLPYGAVVLIWRLIYSALGYGVWGSGMYLDPMREPLPFITAALERAPILLLGQWGFPPSDVSTLLLPPATRILWFFALGFVFLVGLLLVPLLLRDRLARFWALGMVLATLPICGTDPMDRLLFFVGLGAMGLLAQFFAFLRKSPKRPLLVWSWRAPALAMAALFVVIHLLLPPILLPLRAFFQPLMIELSHEQVFRDAPLDPFVAQQDLVFINAPSALFPMYLTIQRSINNQPVPAHVRCLASGSVPLEVTRVDERTLKIRPDGGFITGPIEHAYRSQEHPMTLGQKVELTGLTIEVMALTEDDRPAEVAFRFAAPLEDKSLRWLKYDDNEGYVPYSPPEVGETEQMQAVWSR